MTRALAFTARGLPSFRLGFWLPQTLMLGLIGAGIIHIAVVLLLPFLSDNTMWSRIAAATDLYEPLRLDQSRVPGLTISNPDPLFQIVACRFDLDDGLIRFQAQGNVPYWSASIYDRSGANVYSFNDRGSASGALDFVVLTPAQTGEVRKEIPAELQTSSFIETDSTEGLAVIRAFVPDQTWASTASAFLGSLTCRPL